MENVAVIYLHIVFLSFYYLSTDGACTLPAEFDGTWYDSDFNTGLIVDGSTKKVSYGWSYTAYTDTVSSFTCVDSDENTWVFKSDTTITVFGLEYFTFKCMDFKKITDYSYMYYISAAEELETNNRRISFIKEADYNAGMTLTQLCTPLNSQPGPQTEEFNVLVKSGHMNDINQNLPSALLGVYAYTVDDGTNPPSCGTGSVWDDCTNRTMVVFNYTQCGTTMFDSTSGVFHSVYSLTSGSTTFVILINTDSSTANRFTCLAVSGTNVTSEPGSCAKGQNTTYRTRDASSRLITLTAYELCPFTSETTSSSSNIAIIIAIVIVILLIAVIVGGLLYYRRQRGRFPCQENRVKNEQNEHLDETYNSPPGWFIVKFVEDGVLSDPLQQYKLENDEGEDGHDVIFKVGDPCKAPWRDGGIYDAKVVFAGDSKEKCSKYLLDNKKPRKGTGKKETSKRKVDDCKTSDLQKKKKDKNELKKKEAANKQAAEILHAEEMFRNSMPNNASNFTCVNNTMSVPSNPTCTNNLTPVPSTCVDNTLSASNLVPQSMSSSILPNPTNNLTPATSVPSTCVNNTMSAPNLHVVPQSFPSPVLPKPSNSLTTQTPIPITSANTTMSANLVPLSNPPTIPLEPLINVVHPPLHTNILEPIPTSISNHATPVVCSVSSNTVTQIPTNAITRSPQYPPNNNLHTNRQQHNDMSFVNTCNNSFSSMLSSTNYMNHNINTQYNSTHTYSNCSDQINDSVSSSSAVSALLSLSDCGECILKESRYNQLKLYTDRLETDVSYWKNEAARLQKELDDEKDSTKEIGQDSAKAVFQTDGHYMPKRGLRVPKCNFIMPSEDQPIPSGYVRLVEAHSIFVPVVWLNELQGSFKGKTKSCALKLMISGFYEPNDVVNKTGLQLSDTPLGKAIKAYALLNFQMESKTIIAAFNSKIGTMNRALKLNRVQTAAN